MLSLEYVLQKLYSEDAYMDYIWFCCYYLISDSQAHIMHFDLREQIGLCQI